MGAPPYAVGDEWERPHKYLDRFFSLRTHPTNIWTEILVFKLAFIFQSLILAGMGTGVIMKPELLIQILTTVIILLVGWAVKQMKDENKLSNDAMNIRFDSLNKSFSEYEKEFKLFKDNFFHFQLELKLMQQQCNWNHRGNNTNAKNHIQSKD